MLILGTTSTRRFNRAPALDADAQLHVICHPAEV